MTDAEARQFAPHGSAAGFDAGCRSRGGCPNHGSPVALTCFEANVARRADFTIAHLPPDEPIGRAVVVPSRTRPVIEASSRQPRKPPPAMTAKPGGRKRAVRSEPTHGTTTGYLRGCRRHEECPRGKDGASCQQVRNRSRRALARQRGVASRPAAVDALPARQHIAELQAAGISLRNIAKLCGVGHTTVTSIACGATNAIWPRTLERITSSRG